MNQSIANQIRRARQNKDLSQENVADELGITKGAYSKIERGVTAISVDRLEEIAKILDVKVGDFFTDKKALGKSEDRTKGYGFATKDEVAELAQMIQSLADELQKIKSALQPTQGAEEKKPKKKK